MMGLALLTSMASAVDAPTFQPGTVDLTASLGFQAVSYSPFGIALAFAGWNDLAAGVDVGVWSGAGVVVGVGAEVYGRRPWVLRQISTGLIDEVDTGSGQLDFDVREQGLLASGTVHLTRDILYAGDIDLYGTVLAGPAMYRQRVSYTNPLGNGSFDGRFWGLRAGLGVGATLSTGSGLLLLGRLRYLFTAGFEASDPVVVTDASGLALETYRLDNPQRTPRGFGWSFGVGYRF